jgi:manganese transport protein
VLGVVLTAADVLLILFLQGRGFRFVEALVMALIGTIGVCFAIELVMARPEIGPLLAGYVPTPEIVFNPEALYIAIGILGATVMPHNLYLHSSIVQTRAVRRDSIEEQRSAVKHATVDSTVALMMALFINSAILILSAAVFNATGNTQVDSIEDAHALLTPLLGTGLASVLFALALLASGQNSTLTGTLAGQIVMEGFLALRIRPWVRRIITRLLAIVPAVIVVWLYGEQGTVQLLILSQVVLSMQLPFAIWPLLRFTSDARLMGRYANGLWPKLGGWTIFGLIAAANLWLIVS